MGDTKQSLSWMRERAWFQISVFIVFFVLMRWLVLGSFNYLFDFIGVNSEWIHDTARRNEMGIQIVSFILTEALLGLLSQNRGFLVDFAFLGRFKEIAWTELLTAFSERFFMGFLAASAAVALSVFSGVTLLESPVDWLSLIFAALPKIVFQVLTVIAWFLCLELFRYPLWARLAPESSARFQGRLLLIFFQGWLLYLVAWGGQIATDWQIFSFAISVWLSAQIFLWAETSWTLNSTKNFWPHLLGRVAFCSSFLTSLIYVYGFPSAGRHEVSLVYSIGGPTLAKLSAPAFDSFLSQGPVLIVLAALTIFLLRRSAQSLNRAR